MEVRRVAVWDWFTICVGTGMFTELPVQVGRPGNPGLHQPARNRIQICHNPQGFGVRFVWLVNFYGVLYISAKRRGLVERFLPDTARRGSAVFQRVSRWRRDNLPSCPGACGSDEGPEYGQGASFEHVSVNGLVVDTPSSSASVRLPDLF